MVKPERSRFLSDQCGAFRDVLEKVAETRVLVWTLAHRNMEREVVFHAVKIALKSGAVTLSRGVHFAH